VRPTSAPLVGLTGRTAHLSSGMPWERATGGDNYSHVDDLMSGVNDAHYSTRKSMPVPLGSLTWPFSETKTITPTGSVLPTCAT